MRIIRKNNYFEINGFVINRKYNYNEFTRNDEETGRTYNVGEHKVPSVTTILSKTQSQEKKQAVQQQKQIQNTAPTQQKLQSLQDIESSGAVIKSSN